jgi:hypothetical protein
MVDRRAHIGLGLECSFKNSPCDQLGRIVDGSEDQRRTNKVGFARTAGAETAINLNLVDTGFRVWSSPFVGRAIEIAQRFAPSLDGRFRDPHAGRRW